MIHPKLPAKVAHALRTPACPMLAGTDPRVRAYLDLWRWWRLTDKRHLPRAGGLEDQRRPDLEALELVEHVMTTPWEAVA